MGQTLNEKKQAFEKISNEYEQFKVSYNEKTERLNSTEELIQTLTTGISAEEGRENGYAEQLKQSKSVEWQASTAEDQASLKIEYFRRELSEKEPQIAKELANSQKFVSELEEKRAAVNKLEVIIRQYWFLIEKKVYANNIYIGTISCVELES